MALISAVRRGFATAAVAGVLVFAVPITSEALVAPVPIGQYVIGAVRAAAPAIAGSSVIGPEGTLIASTVVALGALAYVTRDTWMPWVKGLFGAGGNTSTVIGTRPFIAGFNANAALGGTSTFTITHTTSVAGQALAFYTFSCKDAVSGVVTSGGHPYLITPYYYSNGGLGQIATTNVTCAAGSGLNSFQSERDVNNNPTANTVSWGAPFDAYADSTYRVDVTCRKADGSTAVISATTTNPGNPSVPLEGPAGGGLLVPSCAAQWGDSHGEGLTVNGAQTGSPLIELSHQLFPSTSTLYPNCVGAGNACTYVVEYNGVPCVVGQAECVAWTRSALLDPDAYECRFGEYLMTLAQCAVNERVYEPNGAVLTQLNTDGNPNTYDLPIPAWAPQPVPDGAPGGAPAQVPGTQTTPSTTQTNNTDCWPSGTAAWNPAEWVLTPVKCALTWAFVPRTATLTTLSGTVGTDMARVGIAPIASGVATNVGLVGSGTGCLGPEVTFAAVGVNEVMHPFAACSGVTATLATISRALSTMAIIGIGGFSALRAIGAGFGFNVSMGRGKAVDV